MIDLKVVFVLAVWVCTIVCDKKDEFLRHSQLVSPRKFPCSVPQPRVFHLRDLMDEEEYLRDYRSIIRDIHPVATVLYRCQKAGCCDNYNERCDALDEDEIDLTYMALRHGRTNFFTITARNHTSCGCQKISDNLIK